MKKKFLLSTLLLLLSICMLFSSCEKVDLGEGDPKDTTESGSTETVFGIWYSMGNQSVVVIPEDLSSITFYQLKIGYYEYSKKIVGSCTYEDHILTLTADDGYTYSWVFDTKTGVLSASTADDDSSYVKKDTLPTEFVEIPFPDFASVNYDELLTIGKYTDLTYSADITAEAAISIFKSYYSATGKTPTTVTNRVVQRGDYVNIDYTGYLDDVAFSGGAATSQDVAIVENSGYIPGFAEGIIGQTAGSTFDVTVTFPEDYHSTDMAGKTVVFKMTLNKIYDLSIADADVASYTENKHTTYQSLLTDNTKTLIKETLWNQVVNASECADMPESLYGYFYGYYRDMYHYYAALYQTDYELFLSYYGLADKDFLAEGKKQALSFAVAYAISAKYNLSYTEDEYNAKVEELVTELMENASYSREDAVAYVNKEAASVKADLTVIAVMEWLYNQTVNQQ